MGQPSLPARPQAAPASANLQGAPSLARTVIRAQSADESAQSAALPLLSLPPPEQMGVTEPRPSASTTWDQAHRRLEQLKASYHMDKLPDGGCRFTCMVPGKQAGYRHRIEAQATTELQAVQFALERAEAWARQP